MLRFVLESYPLPHNYYNTRCPHLISPQTLFRYLHLLFFNTNTIKDNVRDHANFHFRALLPAGGIARACYCLNDHLGDVGTTLFEEAAASLFPDATGDVKQNPSGSTKDYLTSDLNPQVEQSWFPYLETGTDMKDEVSSGHTVHQIYKNALKVATQGSKSMYSAGSALGDQRLYHWNSQVQQVQTSAREEHLLVQAINAR